MFDKRFQPVHKKNKRDSFFYKSNSIKLKEVLIQRAKNIKTKLLQKTQNFDNDINKLMNRTLNDLKSYRTKQYQKSNEIIYNEEEENIRLGVPNKFKVDLSLTKFEKQFNRIKDRRNKVYSKASVFQRKSASEMLYALKDNLKKQYNIRKSQLGVSINKQEASGLSRRTHLSEQNLKNHPSAQNTHIGFFDLKQLQMVRQKNFQSVNKICNFIQKRKMKYSKGFYGKKKISYNFVESPNLSASNTADFIPLGTIVPRLEPTLKVCQHKIGKGQKAVVNNKRKNSNLENRINISRQHMKHKEQSIKGQEKRKRIKEKERQCLDLGNTLLKSLDRKVKRYFDTES